MQRKNEKGFTLLELLVCLFLLSSLMVISLNKTVLPDREYLNFIAEYNYHQATSLNEEEVKYENDYSEYPIVFSHQGMVNMGQSFQVSKRKIIIRPITGYIRDEK